jgi:hypothetical protein
MFMIDTFEQINGMLIKHCRIAVEELPGGQFVAELASECDGCCGPMGERSLELLLLLLQVGAPLSVAEEVAVGLCEVEIVNGVGVDGGLASKCGQRQHLSYRRCCNPNCTSQRLHYYSSNLNDSKVLAKFDLMKVD